MYAQVLSPATSLHVKAAPDEMDPNVGTAFIPAVRLNNLFRSYIIVSMKNICPLYDIFN